MVSVAPIDGAGCDVRDGDSDVRKRPLVITEEAGLRLQAVVRSGHQQVEVIVVVEVAPGQRAAEHSQQIAADLREGAQTANIIVTINMSESLVAGAAGERKVEIAVTVDITPLRVAGSQGLQAEVNFNKRGVGNEFRLHDLLGCKGTAQKAIVNTLHRPVVSPRGIDVFDGPQAVLLDVAHLRHLTTA